jgi:hypothetical protein
VRTGGPVNLKEVLSISAAILASLGGAGVIVVRFSGYIGKIWADRALEDQRHKYSQLNLQLQNQLDMSTRRLQIELDAVGLFHKLRTTEEFTRLAGLWKRVANLKSWFNAIAAMGLTLTYAEEDAQKKWEEKKRQEFEAGLGDAAQFLGEEMLFIPKPIVDAAQRAITQATMENFTFAMFREHLGKGGSPEARLEYHKASDEYLKSFNATVDELESLMRAHISGQVASESASLPDKK